MFMAFTCIFLFIQLHSQKLQLLLNAPNLAIRSISNHIKKVSVKCISDNSTVAKP